MPESPAPPRVVALVDAALRDAWQGGRYAQTANVPRFDLFGTYARAALLAYITDLESRAARAES